MSATAGVSSQKRPNVRIQAWLSQALSWWRGRPLDFSITEEELWADLRWGRR
jgi:hypothetical protein